MCSVSRFLSGEDLLGFACDMVPLASRVLPVVQLAKLLESWAGYVKQARPLEDRSVLCNKGINGRNMIRKQLAFQRLLPR